MKMKNILVIAPHADDETLGCGGTILKLKKCKVYWLLITSRISPNIKNSKKNYENLKKKISKKYSFEETFQLPYATSKLSFAHLKDLIQDIKKVISKRKIDTVFSPYVYDAHSDHYITASAASSACKTFRSPTIKNLLFYETLSETNFNFTGRNNAFRPNVYIDISNTIKKKISISKLYKSEFQKHPFPRSDDTIRSLALLRGSESGVKNAEAFMATFIKF